MTGSKGQTMKLSYQVVTDFWDAFDRSGEPQKGASLIEYGEQMEQWRADLVNTMTARLSGNEFSLYSDGDGPASATSAAMLANRLLMFNCPRSRSALQFYCEGITSTVRGFLIRRYGAKSKCPSQPFRLHLLDRMYSSFYDDEVIHAIGRRRYGLQNIRKSYWSYNVSQAGRAWMINLFVHTINCLSLLAAEAAKPDIAVADVFKPFVTINEGDLPTSINYAVRNDTIELMQGEIFDDILECLESLGMRTTRFLMSRAAALDLVTKRRKMLKRTMMVSDVHLFRAYLNGTEESVRQTVRLIYQVLRILVRFNVITDEEGYGETFGDGLHAGLRAFITTFRNLFISLHKDIDSGTKEEMIALHGTVLTSSISIAQSYRNSYRLPRSDRSKIQTNQESTGGHSEAAQEQARVALSEESERAVQLTSQNVTSIEAARADLEKKKKEYETSIARLANLERQSDAISDSVERVHHNIRVSNNQPDAVPDGDDDDPTIVADVDITTTDAVVNDSALVPAVTEANEIRDEGTANTTTGQTAKKGKASSKEDKSLGSKKGKRTKKSMISNVVDKVTSTEASSENNADDITDLTDTADMPTISKLMDPLEKVRDQLLAEQKARDLQIQKINDRKAAEDAAKQKKLAAEKAAEKERVAAEARRVAAEARRKAQQKEKDKAEKRNQAAAADRKRRAGNQSGRSGTSKRIKYDVAELQKERAQKLAQLDVPIIAAPQLEQYADETEYLEALVHYDNTTANRQMIQHFHTIQSNAPDDVLTTLYQRQKFGDGHENRLQMRQQQRSEVTIFPSRIHGTEASAGTHPTHILAIWAQSHIFGNPRTSTEQWVDRYIELNNKVRRSATDTYKQTYATWANYSSTWFAVILLQCMTELQGAFDNIPKLSDLRQCQPGRSYFRRYTDPYVDDRLHVDMHSLTQRSYSTVHYLRTSDVVHVSMFKEDRFVGAFVGFVRDKHSVPIPTSRGMYSLTFTIQTLAYTTDIPLSKEAMNCNLRVIGYLGTEITSYTSLSALQRCWNHTDLHSMLVGVKDALYCEGSENPFQEDDGSSQSIQQFRAATEHKYAPHEDVYNYIEKVYNFDGTPNLPQLAAYGCLNKMQCLQLVIASSLFESVANTQRDKTAAVIGPAGTGKTSTVYHIITMFMNMYYNPLRLERAEECRQNAVKQFTEKKQRSNLLFPAYEPEIRILVVGPTHASLNVIEEKLQRGIPIIDENDSVTNVIPSFQRTPPPPQTESSTNAAHVKMWQLYRSARSMFPFRKYLSTDQTISLATYGSIHRVFPDRDGPSSRQFHMFDVILLDESSQVSDDMMFPLLYNIARFTPRTERPTIMFFGDQVQLQPIVPGVDNILARFARSSYFDRLVSEGSPDCQGTNSVLTSMLDIQYRMHPSISRASNVIARRTVRDATPPLTDSIVGYVQDLPLRWTGTMSELQFSDVQAPLRWFDPYVQSRKNMIPLYNHPENLRADSPERSWPEALIVCRLVELLLSVKNFNVSDVLVLTVYTKQKDLLHYLLRNRLGVQGDDVDVATVASSQGAERTVVIYSTARTVPKQNQTSRVSFGILDNVRNLYVALTRSRRHMFFVGDFEAVRRNATSWGEFMTHLSTEPEPEA